MSSLNSERFSLIVVRRRDETTVVVIGELDIASADKLRDEVQQQWIEGCSRVVVDLRRVPFMDSTGLRILLALRTNAERDCSELVLVPGPPEIERIFAVTATLRTFDWLSKDSPRQPRARPMAGSGCTSDPSA